MLDSPDCTISVFTLNIWGLPALYCKNKGVRLEAIATVLSESRYDIICLQEVWCEDDYQMIRNRISAIFPFAHYFYSGVNGSGLCIFTKWPLQATFFHQWPVNGYIHKISHADWYGGKGVGLCQISINGTLVNIYTTHLHAQYDSSDKQYLSHRVVQAFDTAQFIRLTSSGCHLAILAGDLNTKPGDICHQLIQHSAYLIDTYSVHTEGCRIGTNECSRNSYTSKRKMVMAPMGDRIDYILYKASMGAQAEVVSYRMPMAERIPGHDFSYSDHEAIAATIRVSTKSITGLTIPEDHPALEAALNGGISVCKEALARLAQNKFCYWLFYLAFFILLLVIPFVTEIPSNYLKLYYIVMIIITPFVCYLAIMATTWNRIETNGIRGAKKRMQVMLDTLKQPKTSFSHHNFSLETPLLIGNI